MALQNFLLLPIDSGESPDSFSETEGLNVPTSVYYRVSHSTIKGDLSSGLLLPDRELVFHFTDTTQIA